MKQSERRFTTTQAADRLGLSVNTVKTLARAGRLPFSFGKARIMLFTDAALAVYEQSHGKITDDQGMRGNHRYYTPHTLAAAAGTSPFLIRKAVLEGRLHAVRGPGMRAWFMISFREGDRFISEMQSHQHP